jgi:hypothetical protein
VYDYSIYVYQVEVAHYPHQFRVITFNLSSLAQEIYHADFLLPQLLFAGCCIPSVYFHVSHVAAASRAESDQRNSRP